MEEEKRKDQQVEGMCDVFDSRSTRPSLNINGLDEWAELRRIPDSLKNLIRYIVVFQSNGRNNSLLLITCDDKVYGLGVNGSDTNILGLNSPHYECERVERPELVKGLSGKNIVHLTVGDNIGAALDHNGQLYWWGNCDEVDDEIVTPHLASMSTKIKFTQVSCGSRFMAALTLAGDVYVWGKLKAGTAYEFMRKVKLDVSSHKIIKLSSGKTHLVMLTATGAVYTWGCYDRGERGFQQHVNIEDYVPKELQLNQPCNDIACGFSSTILLTSSGDIWACREKFQLERIHLSYKISKVTVGWCCVNGTYQSFYVATAINGKNFVWNDTTGPGEPVNTPIVDLFPGGTSPRDIMFSVLQLPPTQRNVKCLRCMKSDQIQFVLNGINERFSLLEEITTEMVHDLRRVISEEKPSEKATEPTTVHSTVATQTDDN